MKRPTFFIGRYPDGESFSQIKQAQEKLEDVDKKIIVQRPHLTYAGSKPIVKATLNLSVENLNTLIHPLPDTATEMLTLGVKGLRLVQGRRLLPYLTIELEDDGGIFSQERGAVYGRVAEYLNINPMRDIPPHVSLARVGLESLSLQLVDGIEEDLPTSMTFKPISFPNYDRFGDEGISDITKLTPRKSIRPKQAPVPQGLLDSFRSARGE